MHTHCTPQPAARASIRFSNRAGFVADGPRRSSGCQPFAHCATVPHTATPAGAKQVQCALSVRVDHSRHCEWTLRAGAGFGRLYVRPLAHEWHMNALSRAVAVVVNQRTPHAFDAAHVSLAKSNHSRRCDSAKLQYLVWLRRCEAPASAAFVLRRCLASALRIDAAKLLLTLFDAAIGGKEKK